ncbi:hypothetical protein BDP55DRAFT_625854 [Colletotrichum godetiae]|uniref:Uncharacterized protein n=1 Tax=Colletotrichum godetiae TaxID=1209918 RepID=A0AAJ0AXR9_9PEZI|nr:uncharacterized protein BDP55DRAFT_625854 [Colletotrichum godetiae]KAK1700255.1 hypothetical protein BDP55DRAFT_625854 [Colletotrichum godetiae]
MRIRNSTVLDVTGGTEITLPTADKTTHNPAASKIRIMPETQGYPLCAADAIAILRRSIQKFKVRYSIRHANSVASRRTRDAEHDLSLFGDAMHRGAAIGPLCQGEFLVLDFNVSTTSCGVREIVAPLRLAQSAQACGALLSDAGPAVPKSRFHSHWRRWTRGFTGADCISSKQGRATDSSFSQSPGGIGHSRAGSGSSGLHLPLHRWDPPI